MNRRAFVTGLGAALAAPRAAEAQAGKPLRIGVLSPAARESQAPPLAIFRQALRDLGNIEGQNVAFEIRYADGRLERLAGFADELVRLKVDVIVAPSDPSIAAAQKATTSIPIVMVTSTDPVGSAFVASLARPGGNITGLTVQSSDVVAKRLQLLKEAVPDLSQIAVVWDPRILSGRRQVSETRAAAQTLGVQIQLVEVPSPAKFDGAFASMTRDRAGAAFIVGSQMPYVYRTRIAELAVKHRLPTTCPLREYVEAGCLIGYGTSVAYQWRRAASYVDKILKGAKPGDLPVEQPTKFELVINLKTAKALGLTIPPSLLLRADQVIE